MKLSVATNWDESILEEAERYPVGILFGALQVDAIGGGRPSPIIQQVSKKGIGEYIEKLHTKGIKFSYPMGSPCFGNKEYTLAGNERLMGHLRWLCDAGVDNVIVSIPHVAELIKTQFPQLKLIVSVIAHVNTPNGVKYWEELGADVINIDFMINRDFKKLEEIVRVADCELELLVNDGCLLNCPYRNSCYSFYAHSSQDESPYRGPMSYPTLACAYQKLSDPVWILRSPWIRPEDIAEYEKIGIKRFKISGREFSSRRIIKAIKMYSERKSEGNFLEILSGPPSYGDLPGLAAAVNIDAKTLDGFLGFFKEGKCTNNCHVCSYCGDWAEKALNLNEEPLNQYLNGMGRLKKALASGGLKGFLEFNEQHASGARKY